MTVSITSEIEIRDGQASVGIVPGLGGSLAWFRWHAPSGPAIDWLRPATEAMRVAGAAGMACHPLVPYSNRVSGGSFDFAARHVQLPVTAADPHFEHGHGWRHPWRLEQHTPSSASLVYRHGADEWPWSYEARQDIRLEHGALIISVTVQNLSADPMPAGFGLHPYFPASPSTQIHTEVQGMWEVDAEVLPTRHVDLSGEPRTISVASSNLDHVFTGWSRRARIVWPEEGRALDLAADSPLDFLVVYTPPGEAFFCCEPVSNATNAFNLATQGRDDTGLRVLAPGAACTAKVRFVPHLINPSHT